MLLSMADQVLVDNVVMALNAASIGRLAQCCRELRAVSECGEIWRDLFALHCPDSELTAAGLDDWKHAYLCDQSQVMQEVTCFHSKESFVESVLGIPIVSTRNSKTRRVDYIDSTMDILSYNSYLHDRVRHTVWKEKFDRFLPLYISAEHFKRALPLFEQAMVELCPHLARKQLFNPQMVLQVLPR